METTNLIGLSKEEILTEFLSLKQQKFRTLQIWKWIYTKGATSFFEMSDLNKDLQAQLSVKYNLERPKVLKSLSSKEDYSIKFLLELADKNQVEAVYMRDKDRHTVCVSSQVGCNMGCKFCNTGTQKVIRNLTTNEILSQVLVIKDHIKDWDHGKRLITNIVFMGMGEPLQNYKEVKKAIEILLDNDGLSFSKRRITVSTCGITPMIAKLDNDLGVNLAISLHAPTEELRSQIMPINNKFSLASIIEALKNYKSSSNCRRITIEYIMIAGVNDTLEHAQQLIDLIGGIPVKFNLIPFNPWEGSEFCRSSGNTIHRFSDFLVAKGYSSPIRESKGKDIAAACGQLKSSYGKGL